MLETTPGPAGFCEPGDDTKSKISAYAALCYATIIAVILLLAIVFRKLSLRLKDRKKTAAGADFAPNADALDAARAREKEQTAALLRTISEIVDSRPDPPGLKECLNPKLRDHISTPLKNLRDQYALLEEIRGLQVEATQLRSDGQKADSLGVGPIFVLYGAIAEMEPSILLASQAVEYYAKLIQPAECSWAARAGPALRQMPSQIRELGVSLELE